MAKKRHGARGYSLWWSVRAAAAVGLSLSAAPCFAQAAAANAEIVLLVGKGEKRPTEQAAWASANVNEKLAAGSFVRTLANSQMGLYLPDRTQIRLNQNSQLQIKTVADAAQFTQTTLQLNAGRAWSQAKPQAVPAGVNPNQARVSIQTPTATMGVRGTDWEVEVRPDGETQLVVLSGVVDISNERGALSIGAGEAAVARAGQAPVRLVLVNPASRVQWVSSWKPQPRRWAGGEASRHAEAVARIEAGDYDAALSQLRSIAGNDSTAALLAGDVLIQQGDIAGAIGLLRRHEAAGAEGRVGALQARALARDDKVAEGRALLASAVAQSPRSIELLLAQGELAALDGDAAGSRQAYEAVLAIDARNADAWYGIGLIESERENVRHARIALNEALRTNPNHSQAAAELAATETFAVNLEAARDLLEKLLAREPSNYVALTSLGVYKLKSGQTAAALDDFLKAGLVEPRYSRAWLYAGVAFYQLGDTKRALEAFDKASQLDPRDPVPYMNQGMVLADQLDFGAAIEAARNAQQRMPYLKSLNQVASDQKGSANVGSALANFGLEEWAGYYASESASPYWGGSHLFLSDRYTGKFNRNSELFQGFLTDPTAFGAPSRRASLIGVPGHYGRVDLMADTGHWQQRGISATFNGLAMAPVPMAYYFKADDAAAHGVAEDSTAAARNFTLGLGAKPRHDIGLFAFATDTKMRALLRERSLPGDPVRQDDSRVDLGVNFKLAPDNQFWLKGGSGGQETHVNGPVFSPATAAGLNESIGEDLIGPNGTINGFGLKVRQRDLQFRHAFDSNFGRWAWGLERSRQNREGSMNSTFTLVTIVNAERFALRSDDAWVSTLQRIGPGHEVQADLFRQRAHMDYFLSDTVLLASDGSPLDFLPASASQDNREWNGRVGVKLQLAPLQSLRVAAQRWRRPASVGTLSPVDTVGIAVNDRLPAAGGLYQRVRGQFDTELFGGSTFGQLFVDRERVDNGLAGQRSPVSDFELTQLEALRDRRDIFSARSELEETPRFTEGKVSSAGIAVNHLLNRSQSLSLKYVRRVATQTGALNGLAIPFVPRDYGQLAAQWALPGRWLLGTSAIYRSRRFRDDGNRVVLSSGWSFGATAYWETADKRQSVQAIVENVLTRSPAAVNREPHVILRYSYNFDVARRGNP